MIIALVNPNATQFMTDNCLKSVRPQLPDDVELVGYTCPSSGPKAIEGSTDSSWSATVLIKYLKGEGALEKCDAFVVACFSDHALIKVLRENTNKPVSGIMEASLYTSRILGGRFGIVGLSRRSKVMHEDSTSNYGLSKFSVGVECVGLSVLELESKPYDEVLKALCDSALKLVDSGAEIINLGCAGMTGLMEKIQSSVGDTVTVLDAPSCAVQLVSGIVRMNKKTATCGLYSSAATQSRSRGDPNEL